MQPKTRNITAKSLSVFIAIILISSVAIPIFGYAKPVSAQTASYTITIDETGLPAGTTWTATVQCVTYFQSYDSTSSSQVFHGVPGAENCSWHASASNYQSTSSGQSNISFNSDQTFNVPFSGNNNSSPPSAPSLTLNGVTSNTVSLSWTSVSGATSYTVWRSSSSNGLFSNVQGATAITSTSFTDSNLLSSNTYYYQVTASGPSGTSGPSNTISATTQQSGGGSQSGGNATSTFTAVQNGNWNDPATWGGLTSPPLTISSGQTVMIPAGITVTIPQGLSITNSGTNSGGQINNYGIINNLGTINNGGTIDNNLGSVLTNSGIVNNGLDYPQSIGPGEINNHGTISNQNTINNDAFIDNYNIFNNNAAGSIINNGSIGLSSGDTITFSAPNTYSGSFSNSGTITMNPHSQLNLNSGTKFVINTGTLSIPSGAEFSVFQGSTLTINSGASLDIWGEVFNPGTVINNGNIVINAGGEFYHTGITINNQGGTITDSGYLLLRSGDTITFSAPNTYSGSFSNAGTITMNSGGILDVTNFVINSGTFSVLSGTTLQIEGTLTVNSGATLSNSNIIETFGTGHIVNNGIIDDQCNSFITGNPVNPIQGNQVVNTCGSSPSALTISYFDQSGETFPESQDMLLSFHALTGSSPIPISEFPSLQPQSSDPSKDVSSKNPQLNCSSPTVLSDVTGEEFSTQVPANQMIRILYTCTPVWTDAINVGNPVINSLQQTTIQTLSSLCSDVAGSTACEVGTMLSNGIAQCSEQSTSSFDDCMSDSISNALSTLPLAQQQQIENSPYAQTIQIFTGSGISVDSEQQSILSQMISTSLFNCPQVSKCGPFDLNVLEYLTANNVVTLGVSYNLAFTNSPIQTSLAPQIQSLNIQAVAPAFKDQAADAYGRGLAEFSIIGLADSIHSINDVGQQIRGTEPPPTVRDSAGNMALGFIASALVNWGLDKEQNIISDPMTNYTQFVYPAEPSPLIVALNNNTAGHALYNLALYKNNIDASVESLALAAGALKNNSTSYAYLQIARSEVYSNDASFYFNNFMNYFHEVNLQSNSTGEINATTFNVGKQYIVNNGLPNSVIQILNAVNLSQYLNMTQIDNLQYLPLSFKIGESIPDLGNELVNGSKLYLSNLHQSKGPTLRIFSPQDNSYSNHKILNLSGMTNDTSGIQKITVSVDGNPSSLATLNFGAYPNSTVTWTYTTPSLSEGSHVIIANSTSNDGKSSLASVLVIVDTIPPEAYLEFNSTTKDLVLYGNDTLSGVPNNQIIPTSVVPAKWGDDDNKLDNDTDKGDAQIRTYNIADMAGNTLTLTEKIRTNGHEDKVRILSLQYNGGKVISTLPNEEKFNWSENKDHTIKELEQHITIGKDKQDVDAKYSLKDNKTIIHVEIPSKHNNEIKETGLVLLHIASNNGTFIVNGY